MSPAAEELFALSEHLPVIPHVMQEVVESLRKEDISISELAAIVSNDQVISAKVLRLANSSYYGTGRKVGSIRDAVTLIGLNAFRNLVMASSMMGLFPKVAGFDLNTFWRRNMLVANLADLIGHDLQLPRDTLFSAGLMHSIGQLLMFLSFPDSAPAILATCKSVRPSEQRGIEQSILQMDHFEVGMELARRWNFPESLQRIIGHYDAPADDDLPAQVVEAAVIIATGIQSGVMLSELLADLPPAIAARLHLDEDWLEEEGEVFDLLLDESASHL
jgi:HD-like signal output (HDOD) protein